ncbi:DUF488 family protein [Nonomuraea basaltis]|uniref:DUF488 domain-containing protein n=1 Tax=Nonomuraea basaltis TaxID=2495887 RepID=UPI00110C44A9|nr:DUF488 domain-containing protein [Nonomuraea basaltis]TMR99624.1 DUF488 domain-containing protein [Nonomuraea basaltis]
MFTTDRRAGVTGVGYEGCDLDGFIRRLHREHVTLLIDVRLNPISRKRGFSKTAFSAALADAGIGYEHMRELGNPKWNRAGFAGSPVELGTSRGIYAQSLGGEDARECLERIARAARQERVAVMCFEADEHRCHRDLVLEAVRERLSCAIWV